jgi:hypothetical protein
VWLGGWCFHVSCVLCLRLAVFGYRGGGCRMTSLDGAVVINLALSLCYMYYAGFIRGGFLMVIGRTRLVRYRYSAVCHFSSENKR